MKMLAVLIFLFFSFGCMQFSPTPAIEPTLTTKSTNDFAHIDVTVKTKIIAMAFSMAAEIERDLISSRTTEALRHRKAMGMKLGRPVGPGKSKLDQYKIEIEALLANGSTQRFIAKRYGTTEANLSNWMKKNEISVSRDYSNNEDRTNQRD